MKISSYPALNQYIAMKAMFNFFGREFVEVPELTERMLSLGAASAPEYSCLPVKAYYGLFRELIDKGVHDLFVYGASDIRCCRYIDLFEGLGKILEGQGYRFKMHYMGGFGPLPRVVEQIREVVGDHSAGKIAMGLLVYANALYATDRINDEANRLRPREAVAGSADTWLKHWNGKLKQCKGLLDSLSVAKRALKEAKSIKLDPAKQPIRVAVVGDIFKIHETYLHFDTIRKLAKQGLEARQPISFSLLFLGQNPIPFRGEFRKDFKRYKEKARKYLDSTPASYLEVSVGETIEELENGARGIVHFQSFGCMPDILLKPILDRMAKDFGVPIMHFMRDTHSSDAAYQTRLEAFADLVKKSNGSPGISASASGLDAKIPIRQLAETNKETV